jgi:UDP-N-acetylglucosamine 4,6-dehydratase
MQLMNFINYNICSNILYFKHLKKTQMLNDKSILITGGTGSFGKMFTKTILELYPNVKRLVIYSRDELKQFEMAQFYPENIFPQVRFFIGDVRDGARLKRACEGIDVIIHAAALKQVPTAEYNPDECIKTNIGGAQNVIDAALATNVKIVVALSTDKAAAPINLYGATKLVSDKLFIAANNIKGKRDLRFSAVRYGNVMGSRGSVIPFFRDKAKSGVLPITHMEMTRFNISLEAGVEMVLWAIENALGGEIFVPKIPSYKIETVAKAIAPNVKLEDIGIRPGEKLHEEMITESDSYNTIEFDKYFAILPANADKKKFIDHFQGWEVQRGFTYNSGTNSEWETIETIREKIIQFVDPNFKVQ